MNTRETVTLTIAGHRMRMEIEPEEKAHVEWAAEEVTRQIQNLTKKAPTHSPAKVAAMIAFQLAFDLSLANSALDEAEDLTEELAKQRQTVRRLEDLMARMDTALAV